MPGPERRLQRLTLNGIRVIDDSYNANPASMRLGLDTLATEAHAGERRVAILGTMAELGDRSAAYHAEIGRYARARADFVIGVGEQAHHYYAGYAVSRQRSLRGSARRAAEARRPRARQGLSVGRNGWNRRADPVERRRAPLSRPRARPKRANER